MTETLRHLLLRTAGGVLPNIHSVLLPKTKPGKAKGASGSISQEF